MNGMNAISSEQTLGSTSQKMTAESKNPEFQLWLAGFTQQEALETEGATEESSELPEASELEDAQQLVEGENLEVSETPDGIETTEGTTTETIEESAELDSKESEPIAELDPSQLPTNVTVEQQAIASFFNPMPLRNTGGVDTSVTLPLTEASETQEINQTPTLGEGTLTTMEPVLQAGGAEWSVSSNAANSFSVTETTTDLTNVVENETATKIDVETTIVSQSAVEDLAKTSQESTTSQPTPTVVEIPSSLLPKEMPQTLAPVADKALTQVAQKLGEPLVQKITTMNQGSTQKLTVELLPERLGKVEVTIQVTNNKVQLEFVVQNSQTRQLLETVKPRLEQIMHKQEFQEVMQGKVTETTPVASSDLNQASLSDQSNFQQSFQQERRQQNFGQQINKGKTFSEIAAEKQTTIEKGSIDILA